MSTTLSEYQNEMLSRFWQEIGGLDRLTNDFVNEMNHHFQYTPELITNSNKKIETKESEEYKNVANACKKLNKSLSKIPALDRLNVLSLREVRSEYEGRSLPMLCEPLEYIAYIQEAAQDKAYELAACDKYERQWDGLKSRIQKFPSCKVLTNKQLEDLFCILYQPENDESDNFIESLRRTRTNTAKKK